MNRNYFLLKLDELFFLASCQDIYEIMGVEKNFNYTDEQLEYCKKKLKDQGYLETDMEGKSSINSQLLAWIYVITHPQSFFQAVSSNGDKILIYFYKESIVSLYFVDDDACELIWLPYIHLAIGQISSLINTGKSREWKCMVRYDLTKQQENYTVKTGDNNVAIVNSIAKLLIAAHKYALVEMK